ncbi:hypothetical protein [Mesobacillus foraminis]|uniref:hypothetical protein n=1 Tax=Mesobacillus foraminis TaxID=279826 RepID=UPI000EF4A682|nr:hypothetical protein [Mesobacillus foraminis]
MEDVIFYAPYVGGFIKGYILAELKYQEEENENEKAMKQAEASLNLDELTVNPEGRQLVKDKLDEKITDDAREIRAIEEFEKQALNMTDEEVNEQLKNWEELSKISKEEIESRAASPDKYFVPHVPEVPTLEEVKERYFSDDDGKKGGKMKMDNRHHRFSLFKRGETKQASGDNHHPETDSNSELVDDTGFYGGDIVDFKPMSERKLIDQEEQAKKALAKYENATMMLFLKGEIVNAIRDRVVVDGATLLRITNEIILIEDRQKLNKIFRTLLGNDFKNEELLQYLKRELK